MYAAAPPHSPSSSVAIKIQPFATPAHLLASSRGAQSYPPLDPPPTFLLAAPLPTGALPLLRDAHEPLDDLRAYTILQSVPIPMPHLHETLVAKLNGGLLYKCTVLTHLGCDLARAYLSPTPTRDDIPTLLELTRQLFHILRSVHCESRHLLRDIKPANFCLGWGREPSAGSLSPSPRPATDPHAPTANPPTVFLVDPGFLVRESEAGRHPWAGSPDYASYHSLAWAAFVDDDTYVPPPAPIRSLGRAPATTIITTSSSFSSSSSSSAASEGENDLDDDHDYQRTPPSFADDLESMLYTLHHVSLRYRPWRTQASFDGEDSVLDLGRGASGSRSHVWSGEALGRMAVVKERHLRDLREAGNLPLWFDIGLQYARSLPPRAMPDYLWLEKIIRDQMMRSDDDHREGGGALGT